MNASLSDGAASGRPLRVVVAGGGIAGAEALLALRALAGHRVDLTLVSPSAELVYRPLAVAEPFGLGHVERYPLSELVDEAGAKLIEGALARVDDDAGEVVLADGGRVPFDALVVTIGAQAVAAVEHATTWWPEGDPELYGGLLRDLEEGYVRRLVFAIPAGSVWPLPVYELALMTARDAAAMGTGAEITVVTPEAVPLALFGSAAAAALIDELKEVGIRLEAASLARVERGNPYSVVLQPSVRRIEADRVIAIPEVVGPRVDGLPHTERGFIPTGADGRVKGTERVWAAGDGIAYPVKYGGLATQQADIAAAAVARLAGAQVEDPPRRLRLRGMLMTGARPRPLGHEPVPSAEPEPIWSPIGKVSGNYLSPYLEARHQPAGAPATDPAAVEVEQELPGLDADEARDFSAFTDITHPDDELLRRLGHDMAEYGRRLEQSRNLVRRTAGAPPPADR